MRTVYLHNFYHYFSLPPLEVCLRQGDGLSVSSGHVTPELVAACRLHGKILNVWIDTDVTVEDAYLHMRLLELGVHSIISDMPLVATEVRQNYFADKNTAKNKLCEEISIAQSATTASTSLNNETSSEALSLLKSSKLGD